MTVNCLLATILLFCTVMSLAAQPYSARQTTSEGIAVIELADAAHQTSVSIVPSVGNIAYEMRVKGKNILWFPFDSLAAFAATPRLSGVPLLAPWANRLDADTYFANGKPYQLNLSLGNVRHDQNQLPIHGLLLYASQWQVTSLAADAEQASAVSRLEFSRYADLMAQFPFAHVLQMTYTLRDGVLEVRTRVENQGAQPMPLSLGYHPYFQLHDAPRDSWKVDLPAESLWVLNDKLTPTGQTRPIGDSFPNPRNLSLEGIVLDHVFGDLIRDANGWAVFSVQGNQEKIEVLYGEKYRAAVVYAPSGEKQSFICFEPMSSITNAFNLSHRGLYNELQTISPGAAWEEAFQVRPSGF